MSFLSSRITPVISGYVHLCYVCLFAIGVSLHLRPVRWQSREIKMCVLDGILTQIYKYVHMKQSVSALH